MEKSSLILPLEYTTVILSNQNPDTERLKTLYYGLLHTNFPNKDHLESFDNFQYYLQPPQNVFFCRTFIIMIEHHLKPIGALICEYYPISDCALASYLVVDEKYRGKKLANYLIQEGKRILVDQHQIRKQDLKGKLGDENIKLLSEYLKCDKSDVYAYLERLTPLLFLETEKETDHDPIMDPVLRLKVYDKMGFKRVPFDYIQPNLSDTQSPVHLYLMVAEELGKCDEQGWFLEDVAVDVFIWEFALEVSPKIFFGSKAFLEMRKSINSKKLYYK